MSNEIEAAGAAITAGLAARAIERGGDAHGAAHTGPCPNCGASLAGAYCHDCGQPVHISRTMHDVWHDFVHGVLHFDTKAWKTLPLLAFRPGSLTARYILGQRARFIGPMALFLFCVFLMFFVFALLGDGPLTARPILTQEQAAAEQGLLDRAANRLQQTIAGAEAAGDPDRAADARTTLRVVERSRAEGRIPEGITITEEPDGEVAVSIGFGSAASRELLFEEIRAAHAEGRIHVNTGNPTIDKKIKAKLADPELAWYKIQNTAYKFSFLLVPLSLPLVWLMLFWKRGVTLFDHSVFVLYSLSFVTLLLIAWVLLNRVHSPITDQIAAVMVFAIPVHMFFQLKGGYGLGWFSALWRTVYLLFAAAIALSVFIVLIVVMGLLG